MNATTNISQDRLALERNARVRLDDDDSLLYPEPLGHYRHVHAWVLLADPGAGKTDAFKALSTVEGGYYTRARDFVELDLQPGWGSPIFIDGLDEITAGNAAGLTALGQIRTKLQKLGVPKFRISCREADWRGTADSKALKRLVANNSFCELHLDPLHLSQTKALIAHWQRSNEAAAEKFVHEAENRDLEGLLDNPQTLLMLVKAVSTTASGWPDSKTKTYEMACAQLVQEPNPDHLAAKRLSPLPHDKVLQASGYLSAIMLLSGSASITLQRQTDTQTRTVALPELLSDGTAPDMAACQAALETRLFKGDRPGEFLPVHRTVAEYLGAQYLVSRIRAGLPSSRVLALMLGSDAGVVPELRGLHAWLAAIAPANLRGELIDRDPLGVVLNGDVRNFTRAEKLKVLDALRNEAKSYTYFRNQNWASKPFGALATADMMEDFRARFNDPDRSPPHLALVDCVLDAVANGHHMPGLAPELEQIVHDKTFWPGSRTEALRILVAYARENNNWSTLVTLLADIHGNVVEDLADELLGTLLQALYSTHISSVDVWQYFRKAKTDSLLGGSYWRFWHDLPKRAPPGDALVLLDALVRNGYQLDIRPDHLRSSRIVGELLVDGVTKHGTQIDAQRLFRWLSLGLGPHHYSPLEKQHKAALGQWLEDRPELYKALFAHGLHLQTNASDTGFAKLWRVLAHLYGAQEPDDAELWYLSLAEACRDDDLRRRLVGASFDTAYKKRGADAAIQLVEKWGSNHAIDAAWAVNQLQCAYPLPELEQENINSDIQYEKRVAEESRQRFNFFRETLPSFAGGSAHLGALVEVANAYLNFFRHSNEETPDARLLELLNHDKEWVHLALAGLRQCLFRHDLPSAVEIVDLNSKGRRFNLAGPCMAAMELRHSEEPASALELPQTTLETVVAFRLTNNFNETPAWFKQLLGQRPGIVVDVMQRLISTQIASKKESVDGLYALAHDTDYAEVAKRITPELIASFPVRASQKQLQGLRLLIVSMLSCLDRDVQLDLIGGRLGFKGTDVAQHVYWLTAGMQVAPDLYLEPTKRFVGATQGRTSHLIGLMQDLQAKGSLSINLPATTQSFLIELLGPGSSPSWARQSGWVTQKMELGRYVEGLISSLASNPDIAAMEALIALRQRQDLKHWGDFLDRALYDQRITRRKAFFKPASVAQVCTTLANLKPANAADLWALTVDHLKQLAGEIRDGNTDDYDQYWSGESPKSEDLCRNALLSDLKKHLVLVGVSAEPEGRYADEKRADIKVIAAPHQIPIEIKLETHADIWKAIREQLIAKYSRELASDGYGIYLVFWFTGNLKAAPTDGGQKPKTPQELERRLASTLPEELQHKVTVLVVDCSKS